MGKLGNLKSSRTLSGARIYEMSEVNLTMSEAQKIGADLVALVRDKSHRVLPKLPPTNAELRTSKGLVLDDVLRVLSLSGAGYRELRSAGRNSVITLSRLHRLCKRCKVNEILIPELCRLKAGWDAWWVRQRHALNQLDVLALKKECGDALLVHAAGTLDFNGLRDQAKTLAAKYGPVLTPTEALREELVFGPHSGRGRGDRAMRSLDEIVAAATESKAQLRIDAGALARVTGTTVDDSLSHAASCLDHSSDSARN